MPFKTEHSARLLDPSVDKIRVRRTRGSGNATVQGVKIPTTISIIWYIRTKDKKEFTVAQSLRFPIKSWTEKQVKDWLDEHKVDYITFEAAEPNDIASENKTPCWNSYIDKTTKKLDIVFHDIIGFYGEDSKTFKKLLNDNQDVEIINVDINSPGGSVFDGFSIYNSLKSHPAQKNIKISGVAASIASVIAVAGDKVEAPENAMIMIHKPLITGFLALNADALRKHAETLDKLEDGILSAYRNRMTKTLDEEISEMMRDTTWFTAGEALDIGLIDEITEEVDIVNLDFHDFSQFDYTTPTQVLNLFDVNHAPECDFELEDVDEIPKKKLTDIIKNIVREMFPIQKEGVEIMADEKVTAQLETEISDLKVANKDLTTKLDEAVTVNKNLLATIETKASESRKSEYKSFCDTLVSEGRIRPVDVDTHVENMELRYQEDEKTFTETAKKTEKLDAYKNMLKEF